MNGGPRRIGPPVGGDLGLVHRLQQGALRAGRGAVDLVHQHDVGEDRPALEDELPRCALVDADAEDVAGQQVGRELDAAERAVDAPGDGPRENRLADAGHVLQQHVPAGQQGRQHLADGLALAQQDRLDVVLQRLQLGVIVHVYPRPATHGPRAL